MLTGTAFEQVVGRLNEKINEEAGVPWTPRDAVKATGKLIFRLFAVEEMRADPTLERYRRNAWQIMKG